MTHSEDILQLKSGKLKTVSTSFFFVILLLHLKYITGNAVKMKLSSVFFTPLPTLRIFVKNKLSLFVL